MAGNGRAYGLGAAAISLGVAFAIAAVIRARADVPSALFQFVVPGFAFVFVGVWAIRRPLELARVAGAATAALSASFYYAWLVGLGHPHDSGADIGRGLVGLLALGIVPFGMRICAEVGRRFADEGALVVSPSMHRRILARTIGLGPLAASVLILWQAHVEASPDPEVAHWEFVHHGILPAVPIALVGAAMMALPSRLPTMGGAVLGTLPALACSSVLVDPDPVSHGQTPVVLLATHCRLRSRSRLALVLWAVTGLTSGFGSAQDPLLEFRDGTPAA